MPEQRMYRILPRILQPGFPATCPATRWRHFQPCQASGSETWAGGPDSATIAWRAGMWSFCMSASEWKRDTCDAGLLNGSHRPACRARSPR